jgi:methylated-DNA-[protein]-cysteine S-methyltransferase
LESFNQTVIEACFWLASSMPAAGSGFSPIEARPEFLGKKCAPAERLLTRKEVAALRSGSLSGCMRDFRVAAPPCGVIIRLAMTMQGFTFFDTAIGRCGLAWTELGINAVLLPERREIDAWRRVLHMFPDGREARPDGEAARAVAAICAHLRGEMSEIDTITLDLRAIPPFNRQVYDITRAIPRGQTLTYGDIAKQLGASGAARAVGRALGQNPIPIIVPCHRVLAANGATGGFSATGGVATKFRLLAIEGARATTAPTLFDVTFSIPPRRTPR